jgi:hypothetical protein
MTELETTPTVREDARTLAADVRRWLASGDLQSDGGAYCAWRDASTGQLAFEYPEITGYALTWLAGRDEPTQEELDAGRRAAEWITDRLERGDRSARAGWDEGAVYTFDLGMIAAGLISFGKLTGEERYEAQGRRTAAELAAYTLSPEGLQSIAPDGPGTTRPPEWSTAGIPHLIKCVQSLLLAEEDEAADALIATAAEWQQDDGRFVTEPSDGRTMLHPHIYTIEGLWMYGTARGDEAALDRARRATEWAWQHQLPSGGLPRYVAINEDLEPAPEQWDVTSQAIRAAAMCGVQPEGLERAIVRAVELGRPTDAGRALIYQPESGNEHHNAWVSMFGGQALEIVGHGLDAMSWEELV